MPRIKYTTHDGSRTFDFNFVEQSKNSWKIYAENSPPYYGRSTDANKTHLFADKSICWTGQIKSLQDAKNVASAWAEHTVRYIRTGIF